MKVLLADDQPEIRSALRLLLQQEAWLSVAGEAEDFTQLLAVAAELEPDLVLLDWELPSLDRSRPESWSANMLSALRDAAPSVRIVALSGRPEARNAALEAGVDAFVSKGDPAEHLLSTLACLRSKHTEED